METATLDYAGLEPFRPPFPRVVSSGPDCLDLSNMALKSLLYHVLTTAAAHFGNTEKPRN